MPKIRGHVRRRTKPRQCLRCDRRFDSEGAHNRLCQDCRSATAAGPTPEEEYEFVRHPMRQE